MFNFLRRYSKSNRKEKDQHKQQQPESSINIADIPIDSLQNQFKSQTASSLLTKNDCENACASLDSNFKNTFEENYKTRGIIRGVTEDCAANSKVVSSVSASSKFPSNKIKRGWEIFSSNNKFLDRENVNSEGISAESTFKNNKKKKIRFKLDDEIKGLDENFPATKRRANEHSSDRKTDKTNNVVEHQVNFSEYPELHVENRNRVGDRNLCDDQKSQPNLAISDDCRVSGSSKEEHKAYEAQSRTFNPITKSRAFINVIMAKGRNRNRNRNKFKEPQSGNQTNKPHQQNEQETTNQIKQKQIQNKQIYSENRENGAKEDQEVLRCGENLNSNISKNSNNKNSNKKIQCASDQMTENKNRFEKKEEEFVNLKDCYNETAVNDDESVRNAKSSGGRDDDDDRVSVNRHDECAYVGSDVGNGNVMADTGTGVLQNALVADINSEHSEEEIEENHFAQSNFGRADCADATEEVGNENCTDDENDRVINNDTNHNEKTTIEIFSDKIDTGKPTNTQSQRYKPNATEFFTSDQEIFYSDHQSKIVDDDVDIEIVEQISELTECDRDRFCSDYEVDMGQTQTKKQTRQEHLDWANNVTIPEITVADFSIVQEETLSADAVITPGKNTEEVFGTTKQDPDIFYDSETDLECESVEVIKRQSPLKQRFPSKSNSFEELPPILEDCYDDDDDEDWPLAGESDLITASNIGPENSKQYKNNDKSANVDSTLTNNPNIHYISSESLTTADPGNRFESKQHSSTDSPDSGIESTTQSSQDSSSGYKNLTIDDQTTSYLREGSTDCDENFLQSDNDQQDSTHIVIVDSISLPDVVVETTGMGNHSVKVEALIEDDRSTTTRSPNNQQDINKTHDMRDLVNQEARFSAQIEDAQKIVYNAQSRIKELQTKIDNLEKELSIKSWNEDRLQAELLAAQKEDEFIRKRLKILQEELLNLRHKSSENEDELKQKYVDLETQYTELEEKYKQLRSLASTLQTQLAFAQSDTEQCRLEKEQLREEKDTEVTSLKEALEKSAQEKKDLDVKWHKDFEHLRTQNADREEHLLTDCEWQLRNMQKACKEKTDKADRARNEAIEKVKEMEEKTQEHIEKLAELKTCEAQVRQLRGLTDEQRQSLIIMNEQIEDFKSDLHTANERLEEEISNVRKIRAHCENTISDKDREMIQRIDDARNEVAKKWEDRLMNEMARLKTELEQMYVDDRRETLDNLESEHLEEIKALSTRYNANEQELRDEVQLLKEQVAYRHSELQDLQTKTDFALVQTRKHLDKADMDYQLSMDREAEKHEKLAESLREEFDKEKQEMEESFRERLGHVKEEFARELAHATEEMVQKHRKQMGETNKLFAPLNPFSRRKSYSSTSTGQKCNFDPYLMPIEQQWEQLMAEKEEALYDMEKRHRIKLEEADNRIKDIEIAHGRDIKQLKNNYEIERTTLETRDLQNSQEIEQLHRKCRCLTNLFEEMRMRYERRDPRPEDLREIAELRERCESQERDLQILTERLREIQIEQQEQLAQSVTLPSPRRKSVKKPPSKTIPTSCDVIYEEENEGRESPNKGNYLHSGSITETGDGDDEDVSEDLSVTETHDEIFVES